MGGESGAESAATTTYTMKSIQLFAVIALPLAACGSTREATNASVAPAPRTEQVAMEVAEPPRPVDPLARLESGCKAQPRDLALFATFGVTSTCIAAADIDALPKVAGALATQDRATLVTMCKQDEPDAFVLARGTWLEVVGVGTEFVEYGEFDLEVELMTCEVVAAPEGRHVGQRITMPIGWLNDRIVVDAE